MKILHSVIPTPHGCGLYETARDLIAAERDLGHDARIMHPQGMHSDRGVPITGCDQFLAECDVIVSHSGISKAMLASKKPVVHMRHGRPRSSFLLEQDGKGDIYTFVRRARADGIAWVTLWPEHRAYWELLLGRTVSVIAPPVDLKEWTPEGPSGYGFHGKAGAVNVVIADMWRRDADPFDVIHAFAEFAKTTPGAKLHIYGDMKGVKPLATLLDALKERGWLGETPGHVTGLANVYRSADMLITPHRIATRTVREALACGCQVVMGGGKFSQYVACPEDTDAFAASMKDAMTAHKAGSDGCRKCNRQIAETHFDSRKSAAQLVAVIEAAMKEKT